MTLYIQKVFHMQKIQSAASEDTCTAHLACESPGAAHPMPTAARLACDEARTARIGGGRQKQE